MTRVHIPRAVTLAYRYRRRCENVADKRAAIALGIVAIVLFIIRFAA